MKLLFPLAILILSVSAFAQNAQVVSAKASLFGKPSDNGKVIDSVKRDDVLEVIKQRERWFLVQAPEIVGWIKADDVKLLGSLTIESIDDKRPIPETVTTAKPQTLSSAPSVSSKPASTGSRTYVLGPKGGCYYLNSSGRKTYVEKSLCN